MNLSRLMIPRLLADRGPMHGRQVGAFRRGEHRLEAALRWQTELDQRLSQTGCTRALRVVRDSRAAAPGEG